MIDLIRTIILVIIIVFIALISDSKCRANERAKRFLVYPQAAPTRVQVRLSNRMSTDKVLYDNSSDCYIDYFRFWCSSGFKLRITDNGICI